MSRTYLTPQYDEYGYDVSDYKCRWFDKSKATRFDSDSYCDGSNNFDVNTRSQWVDQWLLYTASGNWIKVTNPRVDRATTAYDLISEQEATVWLAFNGYEPDNENLPAAMKQAIKDHLATTEL